MRQWDEPRIGPVDDSRIGVSLVKNADLKLLRIEAPHDFSCIPHLRVGQSFVGEAVYENSDWHHCRQIGLRRN
jgi:hypothetical protein